MTTHAQAPRHLGDRLPPVHLHESTLNKRNADRFAGKLEADLRAGTYESAVRTTWEAFRDRYEAEVLPGQAEKTGNKVRGVFNAVERIIKPKLLASVGPDQISRFAAELRREGRAEMTIKSSLGHLWAALRWAKGVGLLASVPKMTVPRRTADMKGRAVTTEEFERMLAATPRARAISQRSWRTTTGLCWSQQRGDRRGHLVGPG